MNRDDAFERILALLHEAALDDALWPETSALDDGLDGRFYGPNHEEAGGVFERDDIAGAFSLKRD